MSNLGWYQKITTYSKKVGSPVNFLLLVAGGGYGVGRILEFGIKKTIKGVRRKSKVIDTKNVYTVHSHGESNEGIIFDVGDSFRILEIDEDVVLIEKKGDTNNPYYVSANLLHSISDF